jgi:hypothetical protein
LDAHVPYHDSDWINRCVELALAWGIKLCLMDTDALDLTWLSSFERPLDATREREARAWRDVADVLLMPSPPFTSMLEITVQESGGSCSACPRMAATC